MPEKLLKQFTVESVTRYKDKGVGMRLVTVKEQTFDQWMELAEWQFKPVDVALYPENGLVKAVQQGVAPEDDTEVTAPPKPKTEKGERSPSQRLRDVLFKQFEYQRQFLGDDFEDYYQARMEKIIEVERFTLRKLEQQNQY